MNIYKPISPQKFLESKALQALLKEPSEEELPKHFRLQGYPALDALNSEAFKKFLTEKRKGIKMLNVKIYNTAIEDCYEFTADNIEQAREIVAKENSARGWNDDDCYSEVEGDEERNV